MYKFLSILALAVLATACVPHDPDEVAVEPLPPTQTRWEPVRVQEPQRVIAVQPVQAQPVVVQQAPQKSWWQQNKQKHVVKVVAPTCPCKDPNDPCTHCYQK